MADSARSGENVAKASLPPHPGTPAGREKAWNPQIPPQEFERRFIATEPGLRAQPWDFIVVGAGSAGCVLASRLSQDPQVRVLLLEAGGEAQNAARIRDPRCATGLCGSEADWSFRSAPQPQLLPEGRILDLERGKGLGGSSTLNYSMWVRGAPEDFDRWSRECGCGEEWSYQGVLPHFQAVERMMPGAVNQAASASEGRGTEGEMTPNIVWPPLPEVEAFKQSAIMTGMSATSDYNGMAGQDGIGDTQQSVDMARNRADAFNTFLEPCLRNRPNLCIASEGYVRRLLFDGKACTGVEVQLTDGSLAQVHARLEVVLSAGALQTPQLLMLSGVGDASALTKLGISVVADIPAVGKHLQDHPVVVVPWRVPEAKAPEFQQGSPAGTSGINSVGFWKSSVDATRDEQRGSASGCDLELMVVSRFDPGLGVKALMTLSASTLGPSLLSGARPWTEGAVAKAVRFLVSTNAVKDQMKRTMYIATEYNHPLSRGSVSLRSADPLDPPIVDLALLRDPTDLDAMVEAVKKMREIMRSGPLTEFLGEMDKLPGIHGGLFAKAGFEPFFEATDAQLRDYARNGAGTTWHYSCTARMGAPDAPLDQAVLDPQLRVRGLRGLRVADQSVTPFVVSANTNASSMMIGDKAAKLIFQDHGLGPYRQPRSAL